MSIRSTAAILITLRPRIFFRSLALLAVLNLKLAGQTPSSHDRNPEIESHFSAAQQAQRNKDYPTAEQEYQAVLAIDPDFAEVHMNLGLVYQLQDRPSEAMTELRRALKIKPSLVGANFFLGVDY